MEPSAEIMSLHFHLHWCEMDAFMEFPHWFMN